ncbi:MAG: HAD family phosphatase [Lachnospiraceae bacterium]|nr:HAD family phosphatase [Lachnospiraceae bacterium]
MSKIDTVIFDIGNVLVDFCWKEFIESFGYDEAINERVAKASVLSPAWNEFDRGVLEVDEILELFIKSDPGIEDEIRTIYKNIVGMLKQMDYTKAWIKELKDMGLRVLYLSNFSEIGATQCAKELDFIPLTDGGILSYKVKLTKPEKEIYELLISMYDLDPSRCLFLDDTKANVDAAIALGFQSEVFTGRQSADELIRSLI